MTDTRGHLCPQILMPLLVARAEDIIFTTLEPEGRVGDRANVFAADTVDFPQEVCIRH